MPCSPPLSEFRRDTISLSRPHFPILLLRGGENAVEERHVAAQKYLRALQNRTADKTICLLDLARE